MVNLDEIGEQLNRFLPGEGKIEVISEFEGGYRVMKGETHNYLLQIDEEGRTVDIYQDTCYDMIGYKTMLNDLCVPANVLATQEISKFLNPAHESGHLLNLQSLTYMKGASSRDQASMQWVAIVGLSIFIILLGAGLFIKIVG